MCGSQALSLRLTIYALGFLTAVILGVICYALAILVPMTYV